MIQFENAVQRYSELILNKLFENDITCWIAGGTLRNYFCGSTSKSDIDLFFSNEIEYEKNKKVLYRNGFSNYLG